MPPTSSKRVALRTWVIFAPGSSHAPASTIRVTKPGRIRLLSVFCSTVGPDRSLHEGSGRFVIERTRGSPGKDTWRIALLHVRFDS